MTEWRESDARLPGWTLLKNPETKSIRYRSPSGHNVGAWAYRSAQTHYEKTGIVPQEPLGTKWKSYQKDGANVYSSYKSADSEPSIEIPISGTDEVISLDLPEPKNTTASHRKSGLFTSKELSVGFQSILVIATSILAMALQLPDAQMTDVEVRAIAIPLGNITERSKYNKVVGQMIVDKSDYLQLGYALYMYTDRVATAAREKRSHEKPTGNATKHQQTAGVNGRAGSSESSGVGLKPAPAGLRSVGVGY